MEVSTFTDVWTELVNYFIVGDIVALKNYKQANNLPDDLATEFTTSESGDKVAIDGIVIPMFGVENYPHTIIFNTSDNTPELFKEGNQIQVYQKGYILKIESGQLMLFTWPLLQNFTDENIDKLMENYKQYNKPRIELANGWYKVEILGGLSRQEIEIKSKQGETATISSLEPTFEFIITPTIEKEEFTGNIFKSYKLKSED